METPNGEKQHAAADGALPEGRRSARSWIVRAVLVVLVLIAAVPLYFTASPERCAICHEMQPYYDSWKTSSHRAAAQSCLDCHVRPGVIGFVAFQLEVVGEIAASFQGAEVTTTAVTAPSEACQRDACHSLNREASYSGDLSISHRMHVAEEGIECYECHEGAVHEGVNGRLRIPAMESCRDCHADDMEDCTYCHTGKVVPEAPDTH